MFIRPDKTMYERLVRLFPEINKSDVVEWSVEAFNDIFSDPSYMQEHIGFPSDVDSSTGLAFLPCNLYRLLNVLDERGTPVDYHYAANGKHIKINANVPKVYINFYGSWIDEEGHYVIPTIFRFAAETYCIIQQKQPEFIRNPNLLQEEEVYRRRFVNSCQAMKNSYVMKDLQYHDRLRKINYNINPDLAKNLIQSRL